MRSDLIKVTKPSWVRIVNPEPFSAPALGYDYRYGDVLLARPGGLIRPLTGDGARLLAHYHAPHPPLSRLDCPTDALLLSCRRDLRLTAQGHGYRIPHDPELTTGMAPAPLPPCSIKPGQKAHVPAHRSARVIPPTVPAEAGLGGIYRDQEIVAKLPSAHVMLRPGGVLTALTHRGPHVCVRYTPVLNPHFEKQCEEGAWFWMAAIEFITMETRYQTLRCLEEEERRLVIGLRDRI